MGKLQFRAFYADTLGMGRLSNILFLLGSLLAGGLQASPAYADTKSVCAKEAAIEKRMTRLRDQMNAPNANVDTLNRDLQREDTNLYTAKLDCQEAKDKDARDKTACEQKAEASKGADGQQKAVWKWDPDSNSCDDVSKDVKTTGSSGDECGNASVFKGQLRGQACKETANTVKDVNSQNEALTASTTAITTVYSSAQSMQATGAQGDAQERQKKIMQALAISKIATGGLALTNAMRLKNAASEAEDASSSISQASKDLRTHCDTQIAANPAAKMSMDQCFFQNAKNFRIDPTEAERANFERMSSASSQSQEQADKASNAAKAAMVQGMADALVGVQALQLANQAGANAAAAGTIPTVMALAPTTLRGSSGGSMGGLGAAEGGSAPVDYGVTGDGGGPVLGGNMGGNGNGLMEGKSFGRPSGGAQAARSGVTTGG
ncbi:MAG: hypothetical protein EOP11_17550, partial [Proteobacteria bacterium]